MKNSNMFNKVVNNRIGQGLIYYLILMIFIISSGFELNLDKISYELGGSRNTYYIDPAGNDSNNGLSPGAAWKTIAKVNSFALKPGDRILLKRGGTWHERLTPSFSGSVESPILISSYGNGAMPLISGLIELKGWQARGGGVWEADCSSCKVGINMVTLNNKVQPMGRYPNANATNSGYLTIDSHVGNTSITDKNLNAPANFTGGEVVIRKNHWIIDRSPITNHSGNTISYKSGSHYDATDKFGYFIQNHPSTLDMMGEWYFNPSTKKMLMYFGSAGPNGLVVQASTIDTLVTLNDSKNITIENIVIEGANETAVTVNRASGIILKGCNILYSGGNAITATNVDGFTIDSGKIAETLNNAFTCPTCSHTSITNNTIINTGLIPGMGKSGESTYNAINICNANNTSAIVKFGSNNLIAYNRISNTGYLPVNFNGDSITIKNNIIDHFAINKDDAGGIYIWTSPNNPEYTGRKILGNIISYGMEARNGTDHGRYQSQSTMPWTANGIYIDDNASNIEIKDNTLFNNNGSGIFIHNAKKIDISNNVICNNHVQLFMAHSSNFVKSVVKDNLISNNILASNDSSQAIGDFRAIDNDEIEKMGLFNNNKYIHSKLDKGINLAAQNKLHRTLNITQWKLSHSNDSDDQTAGDSFILKYNDTKLTKVIRLDGTYFDTNNIKYTNAITLKPFCSVILRKK
ncbi:hypothetical protein ACFGVS_14730 [Mucilaginibacter sp. AW1-7]|uniref:hypothetical protein n=1 Tax=Mucilaginibacter sp. AW1-7 TaxID=3349874 RepID=UPI003F7415F9